jgi:hypothetical protein
MVDFPIRSRYQLLFVISLGIPPRTRGGVYFAFCFLVQLWQAEIFYTAWDSYDPCTVLNCLLFAFGNFLFSNKVACCS